MVIGFEIEPKEISIKNDENDLKFKLIETIMKKNWLNKDCNQ